KTLFSRSSKPSWADQVEEEGDDDKCVTSELLKGIPLATGEPNNEPELLPGGECPSCICVPGGGACFVVLGLHPSFSLAVSPLAPLPAPKEVINGNIKTITEYKVEDDGKKFKVGSAVFLIPSQLFLM
uniref:Uncharacterized protein n=1 Tax=Monodelphis domestica TaxID=13616 RepID=A0A5F8G622_MONDO